VFGLACSPVDLIKVLFELLTETTARFGSFACHDYILLMFTKKSTCLCVSHLTGLEPVASGLENRCSIQLSYRCNKIRVLALRLTLNLTCSGDSRFAFCPATSPTVFLARNIRKNLVGAKQTGDCNNGQRNDNDCPHTHIIVMLWTLARNYFLIMVPRESSNHPVLWLPP